MSALSLSLVGVFFFGAVLGAVASNGVALKPLKFALAGLPYLIALAAPMSFRRNDEGWMRLLLEAVLYVALTKAMIWGLERQLRD